MSFFEPGIPDAVQFVIHKHLPVPDLNANHINLNKIKCFFLKKNTVYEVNSPNVILPIVCILLTRIREISIEYIKLFAVALWFEFSLFSN